MRRSPQMDASEEGAGMTRRRTSPEVPASLLDSQDMLREVLLRLPPQPSSLPRASAVCKRWRGLVTDPKFLRRFRARHRNQGPPLLGAFVCNDQVIEFAPILDPPDRILPERFDLGRYSKRHEYDVLDCRHGRVLLKDRLRNEVIVCDPITGEQRRVSIPPEFYIFSLNGAVLCVAGDQGHVHGACHSSPFKVVLLSMFRGDNDPLACIYSSETDTWGDLISTEAPHNSFFYLATCPSTLVGNVLYWPSGHKRDSIFKLDLDRQNLVVIKGPRGMKKSSNFHIIHAEDGAVGLAMLSCHNFEIWRRKVNRHGVAIWLLRKTVALHTILKIPPQIRARRECLDKLMGYDEDTDAIFLYTHGRIYMVQLKSMQSRELNGTHSTKYCYPFTSFYPPGTTITGGMEVTELKC